MDDNEWYITNELEVYEILGSHSGLLAYDSV
jgi:hypothetical protein